MTPEETRERVMRDMPEVLPLLKDLRAAGFDVRWSNVRIGPPVVSRGVTADIYLQNSRELITKGNHGTT